MAISDRIQSIEEHIKESYQELEGIGIDTTGVNKNLENIPKLIDGYWETLPKVTGEGTSITLDNTKEGKMKINLKGNTSQETTTGKNLFDKESISWGTAEPIVYTTINIPNGTYTMSSPNMPVGTDNICNLFVIPGQASTGASSSINGVDKNTSRTLTITGGKITIANRKTTQMNTNDPYNYDWQLESGSTATTYEPYTNGASPNPDYAQDIHVVSGDNSIDVCGKNLFDYNKITTSAYYTNNYDGSFTRNSNGSSITINVNTASVPYNTFSLLAGTYSVSFDVTTTEAVTINNWFLCTVQNGTTVNLSKSIGVQIPANTTTHIKAENYVVVNNAEKVGFAGYLNASTGVVISNIQIEKNNQATTYEEYKGASYPITLPEGMFLGWIPNTDYRDIIFQAKTGDTYYDSLDSTTKESLTYGKWYVNKQIGKVVLNGSENWIKSASTSVDRFIEQTTRPDMNVFNGLNNYFIYNQDSTNAGTFFLDNSQNQFRGRIIINFSSYGTTTLEQFKTWLNTHNTIVYYVLATPTYTEITDSTLLSQLEALTGAKSYNPQTNVSQENNDNASILNATALSE